MKLQQGKNVIKALKYVVLLQIEKWFSAEVEKVKYQARVDDIQLSEKVRIYNHELHQKHIKKSSILKLQDKNLTFIGHTTLKPHLIFFALIGLKSIEEKRCV